MHVQSWQTLYDYNFWTNRQVWDCLNQMDEDQWTQRVEGASSLVDQVKHIVNVEYWWPNFLATGTVTFLEWDPMATRADVRAEWDRVEEMVRAYLARLTPDELERNVLPPFWETQRPVKVWQALFQVLNHSTDHRAHLMESIQNLGGPTVGQDLLDYLFAHPEK